MNAPSERPATLRPATEPPSAPIAVIGMSGRFPDGANSPELLWHKLKNGHDAVTEARGDRWDLGWHHPDPARQGRIYTRAGGYLDQYDGFDAEFFGMSPREARQVDPQHRLLLELAWEAHEDAGIAPRSRAGSDTGVFIGISSNDYTRVQGLEWPDAYSNTGSSLAIAANRVSYVFDFHGPSFSVDTACSSSLVCVHQACISLLRGECFTALAGGVSVVLDIGPWLGFSRASMLSPAGRCKSFDASGDGYVRSEGGGLVLLKPLADAERDGDRILAVILASGVNQDGRTMGLSLPNGDAQEALLRRVYGQCGIPAERVFYVEAHGTGTAVGDPIECGALGRVLGAPRRDDSRCLIGSVKSNIGHLEAASGIAGLTKALLALKHREIPGNLHFSTPNPKIDFENWKLQVVTQPTPLPARELPIVFGVNSFGFGGTNSHLVIQEYRAPQRPSAGPSGTDPAPDPVLVISGQSEAALKAIAASYAERLRAPSAHSWVDQCAAAATGRSPLRHRLAVAANDAADAASRLEAYLAGTPTARLATGESATVTRKTAFVFSGNGPQWWGMGRELLAENAAFRREFEAVDAIFRPLSGWSLMDEMRVPEGDSRMGLTEIAQPMLFAMQVALTRLMLDAGIVPAAVIGHSVGEVAAAWASGALNLAQATAVIFHRSREQAKTAGTGRMAALGIGPDEAGAALADIDDWLEIAAVNAPRAVTVAGSATAVEGIVASMTAAGKFARALALDYPFHTKAMEPIEVGLSSALRDLSPSAALVPFVSTVHGHAVPGETLDAAYWYRNIREPVRFADGIAYLLGEPGITLFVEIGPHPVLKDYVQQCARAAGTAAVALHTLRRPGSKGPEPESDNLVTAICACLAHGAANPADLYPRPTVLPALPLYPWQRTRHWRGEIQLPDTRCATRRDHPLLGARVPSGDGLWDNTADAHLMPYLKDHVVHGAVVFPAAGYVEMALAAAGLTLGGGTLDLENFEVQRPLVLPERGDPVTQLSADARDGTFEIRSRPDLKATDWAVHVRGRLSRADCAAPVALDHEALAGRLTETVDASAHYADTSRRGLEYGPAFRGVRSIRLSPRAAPVREALSIVEIAPEDVGGLDGYRAHPALVDACIQTFVALIAQNEPRPCSTIPVHIARVRSFHPLGPSLRCHVVLRSESMRSAVADFTLSDPEGRVLMTIDGARCQKVDFGGSEAVPLTSDWWRPDSRAAAASPPGRLPAPAAIRDASADELLDTIRATDRERFYRTVKPGLDALIGAYATRAISELHPGDGAFDVPRLARRGGIARAQVAALSRIVSIAAREGSLIQEGAQWRFDPAARAADPTVLWRSLFLAHPAYQIELQLAAHRGESLVSTLRGEALQETAELRDPLLDTAPFQAPYHRIVRAALAATIAAWPDDRPIRILEIAGGGGGLAAWLLPSLPAERTDYVFTDPAEAAVGRAARRFAGYPYARCMGLELDRDFVEQGCAPESFDIVLCAHALGGHGNPAELIERIGAVSTRDALLIAVETNDDRAAALWLDRSVYDPTPDLLAGGYADTVVLDDRAACPEGTHPLQSVYLARRRAASEASDTAALSRDAAAGRRFLLVSEAHAYSPEQVRALSDAIAVLGHRVAALQLAGDRETMKEAVAQALNAERPDELVYLCGPHGDEASLLAVESQRCLTVVAIAQTLEEKRAEHPCSLTLATVGAARTAFGRGPTDPAQAVVWGLGRVVSNEMNALDVRMIDRRGAPDGPDDARALAEELTRRDDETEVQLVAGLRYVNRRRMHGLVEEAALSGVASERYALDLVPGGGLDSLHLREAPARELAPNEVEIAVEAAGLNFRDVLWAMGLLPEEAVEHGFSGATVGMECAGTIARTGAAVHAVRVGEPVLAFASDCFASHVVTDAGAVATLPSGMDLAAAATIPTTFLTAWYALDYLARLERGETLLIHGAAGGVGLAAIQIALLKGARVIGTAGNPRKRRMLELLGVHHVLDSRSLKFADDIMALTGGKGVDAVLNSLAGEAITKSLQCLRPFGRFLEIGKRDLYANSRIGLRPFRNNLSYFGIDADTLLVERPELARHMLRTVLDLFAQGRLKPLPYQAIPVTRAAEAFRAMQQSRHVGKLVASMRCERPGPVPVLRSRGIVRPGVTYLVTGGIAGFGLATARWLIEQGATSLALVGRRGAASDEAQADLAALARDGVAIRPFAADVSDRSALNDVLATVRAEMAPLAGIVHSAAAIEDAPVVGLDREQIERVLAPKLQGAWNLHLATLHDALELFVLYSSSSAAVGNPGQGAYVAANLYLDALAHYRRAIGRPALAVGWGAIKDAGFLTRHRNVADMLRNRTGLDAMPSREALDELGRLLAIGATQVCAARFDLRKLGQMLHGARVPRFLAVVPKDAAASLLSEETLAILLARTPEAERRNVALAHVREHGARVLGTSASQVDVDRPLAELGLDSLMAVELAGGLERSLGQPVSVMQLLSAGSLAAIADVLIQAAGGGGAPVAAAPPARGAAATGPEEPPAPAPTADASVESA